MHQAPFISQCSCEVILSFCLKPFLRLNFCACSILLESVDLWGYRKENSEKQTGGYARIAQN